MCRHIGEPFVVAERVVKVHSAAAADAEDVADAEVCDEIGYAV
jgi:hypothetical protein